MIIPIKYNDEYDEFIEDLSLQMRISNYQQLRANFFAVIF